METITVHPKDKKQLATVKKVLDALDVKYTEPKTTSYSLEFVSKILQGDEDYKNGKSKPIALDDLWK